MESELKIHYVAAVASQHVYPVYGIEFALVDWSKKNPGSIMFTDLSEQPPLEQMRARLLLTEKLLHGEIFQLARGFIQTIQNRISEIKGSGGLLEDFTKYYQAHKDGVLGG